MSHYYMIVCLPPGETDAERAVGKLLDPFREGGSDDGWWDWWQIGGRWTGELDGYDPDADPANTETCFICHGSGWRDDEIAHKMRANDPALTCNGCNGKGTSTTWPTQWKRHDGDIARFGDVKAKLLASPPYRLLFGEEMAARETFVPSSDLTSWGEFVEHPEQVIDLLGRIPDATTVVVVDYHC